MKESCIPELPSAGPQEAQHMARRFKRMKAGLWIDALFRAGAESQPPSIQHGTTDRPTEPREEQ